MAEWAVHQHDEVQRLADGDFNEPEDAPDVAAFDDYIDAFSAAARRQIVGRLNA